MKKKRSFTLLEIMLCMGLIALAGSVVIYQVKGLVNLHRFKKSSELLLTQLKALQSLALSHSTDLTLTLSIDRGGAIMQASTDEPLKELDRRRISLPGISSLSQEKKEVQKIAITIFGSGAIETREPLALHQKSKTLYLDLTKPLSIKISNSYPQKIKRVPITFEDS